MATTDPVWTRQPIYRIGGRPAYCELCGGLGRSVERYWCSESCMTAAKSAVPRHNNGRGRTWSRYRRLLETGTVEEFVTDVKRYTTEDPDGCWNWPAARRNTAGYGYYTVSDNSASNLVYRHVATKVYGRVPAGHYVHHRCRNPACVNPEHLEVLSPAAHREAHVRLRRAEDTGSPP